MDDKMYSAYDEDGQIYEDPTDVFTCIENIQQYLEYQTKKVPFNNNLVIVDRTYLGTMLNIVRDKFPEQLKEAKHIVRTNKDLIQRAKQIANNIIRDAEYQMAQMVDESEITMRAREQAESIVSKAEDYRDDVKKRTTAYIKQNLSSLEDVLTSILVEIQRNRKDLE